MKRSFLVALGIFALYIGVAYSVMTSDTYTYKKLNETAEIPLPVGANYRRTVRNANSVSEEHIYRVCNGKNKAKCGFWENVKTKKKVASGKTTYNKNKKMMIVKNLIETDFGTYMTGNKKKSYDVIKLVMKG